MLRPRIPGRPCLLDLHLEHFLHVVELAADIDVGDLRANRVAADQAPFEEQMRVPLHQHVILERAGLALVRVAAEVLRLGRLLVHELPLHAGREPGAAAPSKPGGLDGFDDRVGRHAERFLQRLVAAVLDVEVQRRAVGLADVTGEEGIHGETYELRTLNSRTENHLSWGPRCRHPEPSVPSSEF